MKIPLAIIPIMAMTLAMTLATTPASRAAEPHFGFEGWFGTYNSAEVQAGARLFHDNCARCHAIGLATPHAAAMTLFEARHRNGPALVYRILRGRVALPVAHPLLPAGAAHDVATYLAWTADPTLDRRKRLGAIALSFLIAFGAVGYFAFGTRTPK